MAVIRLGTRGSPLALAQAAMVRDALIAAHGDDALCVALVPIRTSGDRIQDRPLADIGGKALWTKELDRALERGEIDCAVHSMKDVETLRPDALKIAAMLPRADVRDRLIGAQSIADLPQGARVGTSAPRRAAQLLHLRSDIRIVGFRGNVETRLARLHNGEADATLLAAAGLDRLGKADIGVPISTEMLLPAPSQGAVGIECLADRRDVVAQLAAIDDDATHACVRLERAWLAALGAGCHSAVGALAVAEGAGWRLRAELLSPDGRLRCAESCFFEKVDDIEAAARAFAHHLLEKADPALRAYFGVVPQP